ncbi:hypothetical protein ES708_30027 [subsurface metagenome]
MPEAWRYRKYKETYKKIRERNKEKFKEYYRLWYQKNGRNRNNNYAEIILEWQQEHPDRVLASNKLHHALKIGKIFKPQFCQICGKERKLSGHHEDYTKPLEVLWVCSSCHKLKHNVKRHLTSV